MRIETSRGSKRVRKRRTERIKRSPKKSRVQDVEKGFIAGGGEGNFGELLFIFIFTS